MVLWSVLRFPLVLGPRFCYNQSADLHCELIGWFLHVAGFRLVGSFEEILVVDVVLLMLLTLLFSTFVSHRQLLLGLFHRRLLLLIICILFPYITFLGFRVMFIYLTFYLILIFYFNFLNNFSFAWCIWSPVERLQWSDFAKIVNDFSTLTMFTEKLHPGFPTGF